MAMTRFAAMMAGAVMMAAVAPATVDAQVPLSMEVRLDGGVPLGDSDDVLDVGLGLGVRAALDLAPTFALYGGFSRFQFPVDRNLADASDVDMDTWEVGGRLNLDSRYGTASPYLLIGALFNDGETGLEAGIGADYAVSYELSVMPEVRYRTIDHLDHLAFGMGLRLRF